MLRRNKVLVREMTLDLFEAGNAIRSPMGQRICGTQAQGHPQPDCKVSLLLQLGSHPEAPGCPIPSMPPMARFPSTPQDQVGD